MKKYDLIKLIKPFIKKQISCNQNYVLNEIYSNPNKLKNNSLLIINFYEDDLFEFKDLYNLIKDFSDIIVLSNFFIEEFKDIQNFLLINKDDFFEVQKMICDEIYKINLANKKIIGITGTNGKTTTAYLVNQIFHQINQNSFYLGTLGHYIGNSKHQTEFDMTTPLYPEIRKILYNSFKQCEFGVLEISSHALSRQRIYKIDIHIACWTNFTQDHLNYHKTLENYFRSKLQITNHLNKNHGFLIVPHEQTELQNKLIENSIIFKKTDKKIIKNIKNSFFKLSFNHSNLLLALKVINILLKQNIENKVCYESLVTPDGRCKIYSNEKYNQHVIIDFAHTPDALEKMCNEIKKNFSKNSDLTVLFGCGGDQDKSKRSIMGQIVDKYASTIYLTSDNPRTESLESIFSDIKKGIKETKTKVIENRETAIIEALKNMNQNEVLLIAGKGHEQYQIINKTKFFHSDEEVVQKTFIN